MWLDADVVTRFWHLIPPASFSDPKRIFRSEADVAEPSRDPMASDPEGVGTTCLVSDPNPDHNPDPTPNPTSNVDPKTNHVIPLFHIFPREYSLYSLYYLQGRMPKNTGGDERRDAFDKFLATALTDRVRIRIRIRLEVKVRRRRRHGHRG